MTAPYFATRPLVWLAGRYLELHTGTPIVGRHLQAVPSGRWFVDRARPAPAPVLGPATVTAVTDNTGFVALALEAITDDPNIVPTGATWQITDPLRRTFPIQVRSDTPIYRMPTPPPGVEPDPRLVALDGRQVLWAADLLPEASPNAGTVQLVELTGPAGRDGTDGRDGADGTAGAAGPAGRDGAPGPPGPPGRDGTAADLSGRLGWTHYVDIPLRIVQVPHPLPYYPAGITCTDGDGIPTEYGHVAYPAPDVVEVGFDLLFTGVIRLS